MGLRFWRKRYQIYTDLMDFNGYDYDRAMDMFARVVMRVRSTILEMSG